MRFIRATGFAGPPGAQPAPILFLKSGQRSTVIPAGFSAFPVRDAQ